MCESDTLTRAGWRPRYFHLEEGVLRYYERKEDKDALVRPIHA